MKIHIALAGAVGVLALAPSAQAATCPTPSGSQPWLNPAYSADCRAQFVVAALPTTAQKVNAITSNFSGMGIVMPTGGDGPGGDVTGNGVSQMPAPVTVGASWSRTTAARYGDTIASEVRARNKSLIAAPVVDLMRTWHQGRQAEGFGEDPFLTGQLAASEIPAIQANHVLSMTKHLGAYTQETGRAGDAPTATGATAPLNFPNDEQISTKALQEVYLSAFGAAAKAGASEMMCAFPAVNGTFGCEDPYVFNTLRNDYGFQGAITPDFPNAQHSLAAALNAGCDLCSLNFGGSTLQAEVDAGRVPVSTLDRMIYDKVIGSLKTGLTDNPPAGAANSADVRSDAHRAAEKDIATDGAVLLKNDNALPLNPSDSVAVIGAAASVAPTYDVNGSAYVPPAAGSQISPLKGIQDRGTNVTYAQGTLPLGQQPDAPELPLLNTPFTATYFGTPDWTGTPVLTQTENAVNINGGIPNSAVAPSATIKVNGWSVRYAGTYHVPTTGLYTFSLGDGGAAKLFLDGVMKAQTLDGQFGFATQVAVPLTAGQDVAVRVDYTPRESAPGIIPPQQLALTVAPTIKIGPYVHLGVSGPDTLIAQAVAAARAAKTAVVFVSDSTGEGVDRATLALPGAQDALVDAVAAANPNTIVVLNTGGPVLMPWLSKVKGVLEMWYPGDQFGPAVASLLFGDASPGGRLPSTFPASEAQGPGQTPESYPGVSNGTHWTEVFDEGVLIGYRYYDAKGQQPLFPFGYGLSYTTFGYGPLTVNHSGDTWTASTTITNTGSKAGSEVPQLYVKFPDAAGEAPWTLKGFDKVALAPGESKTVSFSIDPRVWDNGWKTVPGRYVLAAGSNSRDLRVFSGFSDTSGTVGGTVPATLALSVGGASFGAFQAGVDRTYTTTANANVISTAGDAAMTVDGGTLTNGAFALSEPLQIAFSKSTWTAPVSNDPVTITFRQHIGASDPLRTGTYAKTLTFTLSTTNP